MIEILAIMLAAGLVSELVAGLLRLPRMVVLLGAGILLGPEALDVLDVELDSIGAELLFSLGVSLILFNGGLGLSFAVLQRVGISVGLLAVVVRPLTVAAPLLPDLRARWTRGGLLFVGWTRETGVVPVALAGILLAEGVPYDAEILTAVAFAAVMTLGLQSTTKPWLARRLELLEEEQPA